MLIEGFVDKTLRKRLEKFPNLMSYIDCYNENEGISEHADLLPNIVIWFRQVLGFNKIQPEDLFEWDEDTIEDFYSWGTNSRWNHTFRTCLEGDLEFYAQHAVELAEKYGDVDVEVLIKQWCKPTIEMTSLSKRVKKILRDKGFIFLEEVPAKVTEYDLLITPKFGLKSLRDVRSALKEYNLPAMKLTND